MKIMQLRVGMLAWVWVLLAALVPVSLGMAAQGEASSLVGIDNARLEEMMDRGVPIIDIRRPDEWRATGVVAGSHLLTAFDEQGRFIPSFPAELAKIVSVGDEFILICRTGNRTTVIGNALASQGGYQRVRHVQDGIVGWLKSGGAVEQTPE